MSNTERPIYEYVRDGCATDMNNCPNGDDAMTVLPLDFRGRYRHGPHMTQCVKGSKVAHLTRMPEVAR